MLNLLDGLRTSLGLSYLFIAHDLALVKQVSDRVAVMYLGRLCETGPADEVYARPRHPYTVELLDAVPRVEQAALGKRTGGGLPGQTPARAAPRVIRVAGQPAVRVPVPHQVPAGPGPVRGRDPGPRGAAWVRARAPGRVSFPGRAEPEPARTCAVGRQVRRSHETSRNEEQSAS